MKSVQNLRDAPLEIPGFPLFAPNEVREVTDEDAAYLAGSQNIAVLADASADESPKPAKKRPTSDNS
jgi:hypothetical protein